MQEPHELRESVTNSAPSHAPVSARKQVKRSTGESPGQPLSSEIITLCVPNLSCHDPIVPEKRTNKTGTPAAESVEERGSPQGMPVSVLLTPDTEPDPVKHRRARRVGPVS